MNQSYGYDVVGDVTTSTDDANALLQRSAGYATYGGGSASGVTGPNQLAQGKSPGGIYYTTYDPAGNLTSITAYDLTGPESPQDRTMVTLIYEWDEAGHLQQAVRTQSTFSCTPCTSPVLDESRDVAHPVGRGRPISAKRSAPPRAAEAAQ
jgi:YD repeat-containing protein